MRPLSRGQEERDIEPFGKNGEIVCEQKEPMKLILGGFSKMVL